MTKRLWTVAGLALSLLGLAWLLALQRAGAVDPASVDFGTIYASAERFLRQGTLSAGQPAPAGSSGFVAPDLNAPAFHLLVLTFASLPLSQAFDVWSVFGGLCAVLSLVLIARELGLAADFDNGTRLAVAFLLFPGTALTVWLGQVSLVLMLPMTLAWRSARRGDWRTAGAWFGLLAALKPIWLLPLAWLAVRRRWGALGAALVAGAFLSALAAAVFGVAAYGAWATTIGQVDWQAMRGNASWHAFVARALSSSPYLHYAPLLEASAWVPPLSLLGSLAIVLATLARCRRTGDIDRELALVAAGSLLASPLGWAYYLVVAAAPMAGSLARGRPARPSLRWLLPAAGLGLYWPWVWFRDPAAALSLTIGSAYFWGLLMLWCWLLTGDDR